ALRFGARGAATGVLLVFVAAVWGTSQGRGAFARGALADDLLSVLVALAPVSLVTIALGSVVSERERSVEALREQESMLRAVMDGTTDVIFVTERLGRYVLRNAAGAWPFGRRVEELLGKDDTSLFSAEEVGRIRAHDEEVMRARQARTADVPLTIGGVARVY